jgi:ABC-type branched-subunit amino acid transport system ATPase component
VLFAFLDELFLRVTALAGWLEVVGAGLLALVLLARPGGLASLVPGRRRRVRSSTDPPATSVRPVANPAGSGSGTGSSEAEGVGAPKVLAVDSLTVRFGGLTAVANVSLEVHRGQIVGLIGPNGAGKTTIFNAISGLNVPTEGTIALFGHDVTRLPVHKRAALGMARTFQVVQLFPQISVFENLLVATHQQNRSGMVAHIAASRPALLAEERSRAHVHDVVALLGLGDVADRPVAGLPFGVLRMVELARAAVTGAPFVMLDEPVSGLDNSETKRMAELLRFVRSELGTTILLIEHDVPMVTSVSDDIYVVDRGRLLAHGGPAVIQADADVIAAYLGQPAREEVLT